MKIGILTQPLHSNYGGILQAFALQQALRGLGHDVTTVNFCKKEYYKGGTPFSERAVNNVKSFINKITHKRHFNTYGPETDKILNQEITAFVNKYVQLTSPVSSPKELERVYKRSGFDAIIVGSDQVWRPKYSPKIENFFLDFCRYGREKKVAYAASFGVDEWEFSEKQTLECAELASNFDKVSVRESSAVELCRKHLGIDARLVLDPTFLLERSVYENIVEQADERKKEGDLFVYFLDRNEYYQDCINLVSETLDLNPFTTMPRMPLREIRDPERISECVYPSVESWLRSFMDAKFVVTDSFHGCVFSIIFNKAFIVIGNEQRGQARFKSLVHQLGLGDRLCLDEKSIVTACRKPVDWTKVNQRLNDLKRESLNFLEGI